MRVVKKGRTYNTKTMTLIAERPEYTNGNCCGSRWIGRTTQGAYALVCESNGQDGYRDEWIKEITTEEIAENIEGWFLTAAEEEVLIAIGAIEKA